MAERLSRYVQKAVPLVFSIAALGSARDVNAGSTPVDLSTPDKRIVQVDNPQDPAGQEVALALTVKGQEVYPKNVPVDESVLSEVRQLFDLPETATVTELSWDNLPTNGKKILQITGTTLQYVVMDPKASDSSSRYTKFVDANDAKFTILKLNDRRVVRFEGTQYKNPKNGVYELKPGEVFRPEFAVGGYIEKVEEVDVTIGTDTLKLRRIYMIYQLETGEIVHLRINNPVYGKAPIGLSTGDSKATAVDWDTFKSKLDTTTQVFGMLMKMPKPSDVAGFFPNGCTQDCKILESFVAAFQPTTATILKQLENGKINKDLMTADGYFDVGLGITFVLPSIE